LEEKWGLEIRNISAFLLGKAGWWLNSRFMHLSKTTRTPTSLQFKVTLTVDDYGKKVSTRKTLDKKKAEPFLILPLRISGTM